MADETTEVKNIEPQQRVPVTLEQALEIPIERLPQLKDILIFNVSSDPFAKINYVSRAA